MYAVIPARNEETRIAKAIRTVRQAGIPHLLVVVNGCHDNTSQVVQRLKSDDMTVLTFAAPLGVDIPRAIGAAYAFQKGAEHVLFYDGDLIGHHLDELKRLIDSSVRYRIDLALTDIYGTTQQVGTRDLPLRLRQQLNQKLGLEARLGLSTPAHGPHIVSRRLLRDIPLQALAKPPLVLAHAARLGLRIDALAHIPHARLGSAHKGPTHYERVRETMIGDLLEALCLVQGQPPKRDHRGLWYDGYDSERRFDLLEKFVRSLTDKKPPSA